MSQTKVKSGLLNFPDQTDFVKLPSGTTAQRPSSPEEGYSRYNTTDDKLEYWNGEEWRQLPELSPPTLTSVDYPGNDLAADTAGGQTILINGTNFSAGISVEIGSTQVSSVTLNSTTQLAITSPALTAGDYDVTVTKLDATTVTSLNFISYNGVPSWVTASGSLGTLTFEEAISTISLSATEPDGGNVSYAITSGALPTGLTLSSSGDITGTMPSGSAETTYTFTVTATDDENQSTDRSFSITGAVPFVPSEHFNTVLYTGNNAGSRTISGVGFNPDLVWIKPRTAAESHALFDVQRPAGQRLVTNSTGAALQLSPAYAELTTDGFIVGGASYNDSASGDYVAWCWKAGGAPVSNTDGTITSQVSANRQAGFSVVSYTANGTSGATIGHGLNKELDFLIIKSTNLTEAWSVYVKDITDTDAKYLRLNESNGIYTTTFPRFIVGNFNSNVFSVGDNNSTNGISGTDNYIAYCFAETEGFSKFGSYVGTGTTSGNTVVTGFEPAFVMIKGTDQVSDWIMLDNKRDTTNPNSARLDANGSGAEYTAENLVNFLENGFELATASASKNGNGNKFIYMAFAENPNTQVPTKADSFNTVLYNGNGGTQSVTGVGFQPDLVWTKGRTVAYDHGIQDSVRGVNSLLYTSLSQQETITTASTQSFDSDGFTYGSNNKGNASGTNYVAWNWKAGGTPYINENGSIDSVVSSNQASGFSIVKYLSPANNGNYTVGHGLSSAPDLLITKVLTIDGYRWTTYNSFSGPQYYMALNESRAATSYPAAFPVAPDSSLFTLSPTWPHPIGHSAIAYCFHSVAGFSKFGSYSGNGSTQSINVGFAPAFVMFKREDSTGEWTMIDNKRNNGDNWLYANLANTEGVNINRTTLTSTGFDLDGSPSSCNESGSTYIYIAFANQF